MKITLSEDIHECRAIWQAVIPADNIFNLWDVRERFHRHYNNRPHFLVARKNGTICGMIALSQIVPDGYWGCFPGETWKGKTWLEQNHIVYDSIETLHMLLEACPPQTRMRYLKSDRLINNLEADETGYLFFPKTCNYDYNNYLACFSGKSRRKLMRLVEQFHQTGVTYRYDLKEDIELLIHMNVANFGDDSYFSDDRFTRSFIDLAQYLHENDWLRIVTVLIKGEVAGIDMASVHANQYTLLAGAANREFLGVAKLLNLSHIEWACQNKYDTVDFLCGDFGWKENFHLSPRPLYKYESNHIDNFTNRPQERILSNAV